MFSKNMPQVSSQGIIRWLTGIDEPEPVEENDGGGPTGVG
jgi:hypothetical protein